jgi:hypothetical protein
MSCVRAVPTAAPAMKPAMQSTVMAVESTSVGEHDGMHGQLSHRRTHQESSCPLLPIPHYTLSFKSSLCPSLQFPRNTPSYCHTFFLFFSGTGDGTQDLEGAC